MIGNKTDREDREIPTHVGEDFAQRHNMYYLETSAKEAENVERLFMQIAAELMEVIIVKHIDLKIKSKMVASPHITLISLSSFHKNCSGTVFNKGLSIPTQPMASPICRVGYHFKWDAIGAS